MEISGIIQILQVVVAELPGAISTASQLVDLGKKLYETTNGHEPSDAEIVELETSIDLDVAQALSPLPPAQAGDPDFKE